jgi:antitoxin HicB
MQNDSLKQAHIGSTFDSWLIEEGLSEDATSHAVKAVIAYQLQQAMKAKGWNKKTMAENMQTSRAQLDRLLSPSNGSVTLSTLQKAANLVGRELYIELR